MSGRKNVLFPFQLITSHSLAADFSSDATNIQFLDNVGIQLEWTSGGTGRFDIEVSLNHKEITPNGTTVAGTWEALSLSPAATVNAEAGGVYIDLNQLSAPWVRISYTSEFIENGSITTVADVSGSLNDTYFLIDGADGDDWYVWFNVDSGGTDPMVPSRTGIEVDISTDDASQAVASALNAALASCTSLTNLTLDFDEITFFQTEMGNGSVTDGSGPAATGFTFDYNVVGGTANAYIGAKQV